jgi:hypothetical protein
MHPSRVLVRTGCGDDLTCLVTQVAEAAAAEAHWQADAAADRERQAAGQLAAAHSAQRRAEQQLGEIQASIEQVSMERVPPRQMVSRQTCCCCSAVPEVR